MVRFFGSLSRIIRWFSCSSRRGVFPSLEGTLKSVVDKSCNLINDGRQHYLSFDEPFYRLKMIYRCIPQFLEHAI